MQFTDEDIELMKKEIPNGRNQFVGISKSGNAIFRTRKPSSYGGFRIEVFTKVGETATGRPQVTSWSGNPMSTEKAILQKY